MKAMLFELNFKGTLLKRGFWLYVCRINPSKGKSLLYVGRTGDSSSQNASSPFARIGSHFSDNKKSNAIKKYLKRKKINPEKCKSFEIFAYGPLSNEQQTQKGHNKQRDMVAALEKELANSLRTAGYIVINDVKSNKSITHNSWKKVCKAFISHFPELNETSSSKQKKSE